jgi:hypothetical protein
MLCLQNPRSGQLTFHIFATGQDMLVDFQREHNFESTSSASISKTSNSSVASSSRYTSAESGTLPAHHPLAGNSEVSEQANYQPSFFARGQKTDQGECQNVLLGSGSNSLCRSGARGPV